MSTTADADTTKGTDYLVFRAEAVEEETWYGYIGFAAGAANAKNAVRSVVPSPHPEIEYVAVPVRNWSSFEPNVVVEWTEKPGLPIKVPAEPAPDAAAIIEGDS